MDYPFPYSKFPKTWGLLSGYFLHWRSYSILYLKFHHLTSWTHASMPHMLHFPSWCHPTFLPVNHQVPDSTIFHWGLVANNTGWYGSLSEMSCKLCMNQKNIPRIPYHSIFTCSPEVYFTWHSVSIYKLLADSLPVFILPPVDKMKPTKYGHWCLYTDLPYVRIYSSWAMRPADLIFPILRPICMRLSMILIIIYLTPYNNPHKLWSHTTDPQPPPWTYTSRIF